MPKERDPSGRFVKTPSDGAQAESEPEAEPADPGNLAQLLAAGADPQARAGSGGCQPLHLCVAVRRPVLDLVAAGRTVELLLGAGADPVRPVPNRSRKRSRSAAADFY